MSQEEGTQMEMMVIVLFGGQHKNKHLKSTVI